MQALTGGTIYPAPFEDPVRQAAVIIEGDEIAAAGDVAVPEGAEVIDCSGCTITAGFWNSHVHFAERKWNDAGALPAAELALQLQDFTRYGFTNVFDLSSRLENTQTIRARIEAGEIDGPGIRSTGEGLLPMGGRPPESANNFMGFANIPMPEVSDSVQARQAGRKILNQGSDAIKLFASAQGAAMNRETIAGAIDEAHAAGKPAFVHPNSEADVLNALQADCDVLAHTTPRAGPWAETILTVARERALTPTLTVWKFFLRHDRVSAQEAMLNAARAQLSAWIEAGGSVLFGTDYGAVGADPREEYELMSKAGMNFHDILASLTTAPAKRFGVSDRLGRIASGMQADLVVFQESFENVRYVFRRGKIVWPTSP